MKGNYPNQNNSEDINLLKNKILTLYNSLKIQNG